MSWLPSSSGVVSMADDNRFSGLGEELEEANGARESEEPEVPEVAKEPEVPEVADETPRDPMTEPAFEFGETKQGPIYPRKETWEEFEDALDFEVRRILREDRYRGIEKRELHDATLRLAIERPDLVAEQLVGLREQS